MQDSNLLTLKEMADFLKVKPSFLYSRTRLTGPGTIPRIKVGKYIRFQKNSVIAFFEKQNEADS